MRTAQVARKRAVTETAAAAPWRMHAGIPSPRWAAPVVTRPGASTASARTDRGDRRQVLGVILREASRPAAHVGGRGLRPNSHLHIEIGKDGAHQIIIVEFVRVGVAPTSDRCAEDRLSRHFPMRPLRRRPRTRGHVTLFGFGNEIAAAIKDAGHIVVGERQTHDRHRHLIDRCQAGGSVGADGA